LGWSLVERVAGFARRAQRLGRARRLIVGCAVLLATLLVLVLLDAVIVLPVQVRVAGLFMLVMLVLFGLAWAWRSSADRVGALREAGHRVDEQSAVAGPWVLIGLELGHSVAAEDPLRAALRSRSVERGRAVADAAEPTRVFPVSLLRDAASRLWLVVAAGLVLGLIFPGLMTTGGARLLMPLSEVPPYNLTRLAVAWSPERPRADEDVVVRVLPSGLTPQRVEIEVVDVRGQATDRFAMTPVEGGRYEALLRSVREPIRFRLIVHGRPTHLYTLAPVALPADRDPPDLDEPKDSTDQTAPGTEDKSPTGANDEAKAWSTAVGALTEQLERLIEQIQQADPADASAMREVTEAIGQLLEDAELLAGQAGAASTTASSDALRDVLRRLAEQLAALQLQGLGEAPPPGAASVDASEQWLDQAERAAEIDLRELAQGAGEVDRATDSGTTNRDGGPADPSPRDPTATGQYDLTLPDGGAGILPASVLQQVPARYRDHVAAYFRELANQNAAQGPGPEDQP